MKPENHLLVVEFEPGTDQAILDSCMLSAREWNGVVKVTPAYASGFGHTVYDVDNSIPGVHAEG